MAGVDHPFGLVKNNNHLHFWHCLLANLQKETHSALFSDWVVKYNKVAIVFFSCNAICLRRSGVNTEIKITHRL